ncbi:Uncharacterised protein [Burkholderia pseudomallei]|nr:hypothetical protein DO63_5319 [Burkholderia pseudomallei]CAJ3624530.1 Uncharacterised protein [Burkholderia pseudomallei]CAJ3675299.1 Uncharacterised protein [Burkholderia pseudomallei]CAJ3890366.1 Uncharacterised protein [Burkholderia pseudomallei]CAJ4417036.1 Uncharacterised protein [Burkholderia pseudomallei]
MNAGSSACAAAMPSPAHSAEASSAAGAPAATRAAHASPISATPSPTPARTPTRRASHGATSPSAPISRIGRVVSRLAALSDRPLARWIVSRSGPIDASAGRRFRPTRMTAASRHAGESSRFMSMKTAHTRTVAGHAQCV